MKTISSIEELADVMFDVHQASDLDNSDFCASMISCAVSVAARDGLGDKAVFEIIIRSATAALVTVRAREQLQKLGLDTNLEVH